MVKLGDFGIAKVLDATDDQARTQIGTPYYIAPEVLNNEYNEKCDMWSCGVILYIMLSGSPPFYGRTDKEIYAAVQKGTFSLKKKIALVQSK
jgi:calcium-dependent protein kinase